jgi:hypothetical protein
MRKPISIRINEGERTWAYRYFKTVGAQVREDVETLRHILRDEQAPDYFNNDEIKWLLRLFAEFDYEPKLWPYLQKLAAEQISTSFERYGKSQQFSILAEKILDLSPMQVYMIRHHALMALAEQGAGPNYDLSLARRRYKELINSK